MVFFLQKVVTYFQKVNSQCPKKKEEVNSQCILCCQESPHMLVV